MTQVHHALQPLVQPAFHNNQFSILVSDQINLLTHAYIVVIGVAFTTSLLSFKLDYPIHLRLFSLLIGVTFIVEFSAYFIVRWFHLRTNLPLYNIFMLVEFTTYAIYYCIIIRSSIHKKIILSFVILYPLFWLISVFLIFGLSNWNSYIIITGSLFTIYTSVAYYHQLITEVELVKLRYNPEFWIATGLIVFYTCNLPYVGMLNYLIKNHLAIARQLLVLLQILVILMYSIFTYAFLCQMIMKKSS